MLLGVNPHPHEVADTAFKREAVEKLHTCYIAAVNFPVALRARRKGTSTALSARDTPPYIASIAMSVSPLRRLLNAA
jgi:hypothetical protein